MHTHTLQIRQVLKAKQVAWKKDLEHLNPQYMRMTGEITQEQYLQILHNSQHH